jgi:4-diphosphocytidyl-2-C-methyl-D-erythritol kinase
MRVSAFAKLTLSLHVKGVRPDGLHELDAIAVIVDNPFDTLQIERGASGLTVEPQGSAPLGRDNLVVRALRSIGEAARVELHKGIPAEAGLGGGSADAAAILRTLGGHHGHAELTRIAATIGADVPVCLAARATRMLGIGEILQPIEQAAVVHLVIATPEFGCSTPAVYRAWDELGAPRSDRLMSAPDGWSRILRAFRNDLEPAALHVQPRLLKFREALASIVGREPMLCGSGSSYAVWFSTRAEADAAAHEVRSSDLAVRMVCGASTL